MGITDLSYHTGRLVRSAAVRAISGPLTYEFFRRQAAPYLAGSSIEESLATIQKYAAHGFFSTFAVLGEAATTPEACEAYFNANLATMRHLSGEKMPTGDFEEEPIASVSVKPTALVTVDPSDHSRIVQGDLEDRLLALAEIGHKKGISLTLDMESSAWTQRSLDAAWYVWMSGYPVGIVLQSCLDRTLKDIHTLFQKNYASEHIHVRAVRGIYRESPSISVTDKEQAKDRLIFIIEQLFDKGVYVEIATHDRRVIDASMKHIQRHRIPDSRYEFQFLKGVPVAYEIAKELKGERVRFYMPTELAKGDGDAYMKRRLIANPDMLRYGMQTLFSNPNQRSPVL